MSICEWDKNSHMPSLLSVYTHWGGEPRPNCTIHSLILFIVVILGSIYSQYNVYTHWGVVILDLQAILPARVAYILGPYSTPTSSALPQASMSSHYTSKFQTSQKNNTYHNWFGHAFPHRAVNNQALVWSWGCCTVAAPKNLSQALIMSSTHIQVRTCVDCKHNLIHCSSFLYFLNIHQICIWMNLLKNLRPSMVLWWV